jgi:uncharacterized protein (DUF2235 family)
MKHIIIGIDGTWRAIYRDAFDSNVYRLNLSLSHRDRAGNPQIYFYSAGLGTAGASSRIAGGLFADGLDENILQAYINICSNYEPGDKIYLFGFSRGGVAVRALCGFISHAGLLKANSTWLVEPAWDHFTERASDRVEVNYLDYMADNVHHGAKIEFLGVWDAVSGPFQGDLFRRFRFRDLDLASSVKHGVHIVSIDETRNSFQPLLWMGRKAAQDQTIEQIWMPGVHADIGGGFRASFFSTLALLIMLDKFAQHCPEIAFETDYIKSRLLNRIQRSPIAVNDEWGMKWSSLLSRKRRRTVRGQKELHTEHPVTKLILDKHIQVRRKNTYYTPSYEFQPEAEKLMDTEFAPDSWHLREVMRIIEERLSRLQSNPASGQKTQS